MGKKIDRIDFSRSNYFEIFKTLINSICPKLSSHLELGILRIETETAGGGHKCLYVPSCSFEIGIDKKSEYDIGKLYQQFYLPYLDEEPYSKKLECVLSHMELLGGHEKRAYEILTGTIVDDVLLAFVIFSDKPEEFKANFPRQYPIEAQQRALNGCSMVYVLVKTLVKEIKNIVVDDINKVSMTLQYSGDQYLLIEKAVMEFMTDNVLPDHHILNYLSALTYESSVAYCQVLFADLSMLQMAGRGMVLEFEDGIPFNVDNARAIRKMMVLGCGKYALVADRETHHILGLVDEKVLKQVDSFSISFLGHMKWELSFKDEPILHFEAGKYKIVSCESELTLQYERLGSFFNAMKMEEGIKKQAEHIISKAIEQKHGTILVFSGHAKSEVIRLGKKRGITVREKTEPIEIELLSNITAIDGAVFFDLNCQCVGIGVILDGIAKDRTELGDIGRGARYNSALTYISNRNTGDSMAVVISEDGMINVLTEQMGQA